MKVKASIKAVLAVIKKQIISIDDELDGLIQQCPCWQEKETLLTSVPGVGAQTARTLLACLPELGDLSRQAVAALVGVAPLLTLGPLAPCLRFGLFAFLSLFAIRHSHFFTTRW